MNSPLRFAVAGFVILCAELIFKKSKNFQHLSTATLKVGPLYVFISTWILSIFGNYNDIHTWKNVSQFELFHWSILFGLISLASIFHGAKYNNIITKGFGITFLFINLYTRFFEYFWPTTHKALFFGILALSFWILGSKAEKI